MSARIVGAIRFENPNQFWFNLTYSLIIVSAIFGGEYTGIIAVIAYINFLFRSMGHKRDWIGKVCLLGWLISALATLTLLYVHWDVILSGKGNPGETIKSVGWFGVAFMMIDAVRFHVVQPNVSIASFAKWLIYTCFLAILIKLTYAIVFLDYAFEKYFEFSDRVIPFLDLNPNYTDEIILFQILAFIWAMDRMDCFRSRRKFEIVLGCLGIGFYLINFFDANSRAAYFGLLVGIASAVPFMIRKEEKKILVFLSLIIVSFVGIFHNQVFTRAKHTIGQANFILNHDFGVANQQHHVVERKKAIKTEVLRIYADGGKTKPISQQIKDYCYRDNLIIELPNRENLEKGVDIPSYRFLMYTDAAKIIEKEVWWGLGSYDKERIISSVNGVNACRISFFSDLHNHYLDIIVRGGVFSISIFFILSIFIYYITIYGIKYSNFYKLSSLIILIFFIYIYSQSLASVAFYKKSELSAVLLGVCVLLAINVSDKCRKREG